MMPVCSLVERCCFERQVCDIACSLPLYCMWFMLAVLIVGSGISSGSLLGSGTGRGVNRAISRGLGRAVCRGFLVLCWLIGLNLLSMLSPPPMTSLTSPFTVMRLLLLLLLVLRQSCLC